MNPFRPCAGRRQLRFSPAVTRPSSGGHGARSRHASRIVRAAAARRRSRWTFRAARWQRWRTRRGSGGGPGGDRDGRFGRELPSSKYASSTAARGSFERAGSARRTHLRRCCRENRSRSSGKKPVGILLRRCRRMSRSDAELHADLGEHEPPAHRSERMKHAGRPMSTQERTNPSVAAFRGRAVDTSAARESSARDLSRARSFRGVMRDSARHRPAGWNRCPARSLSKWKAHTHLPARSRRRRAQARARNAPVPDAVRSRRFLR